MTAIQVAKLRLRCSTQQRERTRFAIEDGLRTAIPDDRRLVLVRRMQVRGEVGAAHPVRRQDAMRAGWLAAISNARHGADDGAADANCVWFASREEAETVLLSRLLLGRKGEAWYWRLALPDWRGRTPRSWVSGLLAEAIARGQDRRLLAVARCFIAVGAVDQLVDVMHRLSEARGETDLALPAAAERRLLPPSQGHPSAEVADAVAAAFAQSIGRELGGIVADLVRVGGEARAVARGIVRAWALKRSPALALSPELAAAAVAATVDALLAPRLARPRPRMMAKAKSRPQRPIARSRVEGPVPILDQPSLDRESRPPVPPDRASATGFDSPREPAVDSKAPEAAQLDPRRLHSAHAGLWLVVPSLIELGFREWLTEHPALLGDSPGAQLLREVACHHRVALDDPALIPIMPTIDPDIRPEWCGLWRHGLDRRLRRSAGRRLHDLVNRPGKLDVGDQTLGIHYPAADADLALRRRALDRDPGWTDWLGLSIRYYFGGPEDWL